MQDLTLQLKSAHANTGMPNNHFSTSIRLSYKHIRLSPTRAGLFFMGVVLTLLLGAINYNNSLGYALSFLLLSIVLISLIHTYNNLAQLQVEAIGAPPVFSGQDAEFHLKLRSGHNDKFSLLLDNSYNQQQVDVYADEVANIFIKVHTDARGHNPLGTLMVSTDYPFGFLRARCNLQGNHPYIVYPESEQGAADIKHASDESASHLINKQSLHDDFYGFREYTPGDSTKHLVWKRYPFTNTLLTKVFSGGGETETWLSWDAVIELPLEQALSRLCRWVLESDENNHTYGLRIPGVVINPSRGEAHKHACLTALALHLPPGQAVT